MQRWKLILAYDGTPFHGWQVQPRLATVQGSLADAILHITGESVLPQGSGRTDAGVHALGQVASFDLAARIPPTNLLRALNRALPPSIRVLSAEIPDSSPEPFHARHSAVRKTYEYRIFPRASFARPALPDRICPPFLAPYMWDCPWAIDLETANQAALHIVGEHDFTSFAASDPDLSARTSTEASPDNTRTVFASTFHRSQELIVFRITGSGFLHHMVRNLVGTLVDAASGRLSPDAIPTILAARNRAAAGPTAPARGLFLVSVDYPANSPS